ncbi:lipase maturation factor family protein [Streptomyces sp. P01-B04]|uniref:lipase maturation factor family protein n=1 Tax=Streptomyces poriferorum TaxID=2798799 RepID=UPI001C5D655D|nr:lipase maturation factor family protein [Streptomyces poriferorum]MBW5251250.1 lipase maturation factor family protein [Streptomyces poriferorum]MBW5257991.1 lipase maturation factor family protein [Streptomyces poriferorum]
MDWFTADGYWLGRLLFQKALAVIYLTAFLTAALQFRALIGERGMLPAPELLRRTDWRTAPGLFRLHYSDRFFAVVAWSGCVLAVALLAGADRFVPLWGAMVLWALPWALYLSIVQVGSTWYGFGWESLLLETGFLAVFLGNAHTAPPVLVLWLLRWVLFRVEFGAGLIKIRGDACWRKLTCLYFHHETQPMPGPLSWFFHHLPRPLHRAEVAANHVTQLLVPVLLFTPQPVAGVAAGLMILTQLWLVLSGNFAWLNWLTIALALSAVDWTPVAEPPAQAGAPLWYEVVVIVVTALVVVLSYRPARNLISRQQIMNRSFDPLHLVNTYGAFGSISRVRMEVVVEGTDEPVIHPGTVWREYGFRGKPGDPHRLPRQFAPYHLRLDWMMWFAALSPAYARPWFGPFVERLLENDRDTLRLLRHNPFPGEPPAHVRARVYRYRYTTWRELRATGCWWHRTYVREFLRPTPPGPATGRPRGSAATS